MDCIRKIKINYKTYEIRVYTNGIKHWLLNGKLHREDGPAIEYLDGIKYWYLNGELFTEKEWETKIKQNDCDGKIVEIEGKKYKLVGVN